MLEHFIAELVDFLDYYDNHRIKAKLLGMITDRVHIMV
jgi:hypothetical protein